MGVPPRELLLLLFWLWFMTAGEGDGDEDAEDPDTGWYGEGLLRLLRAFLAAL